MGRSEELAKCTRAAEAAWAAEGTTDPAAAARAKILANGEGAVSAAAGKLGGPERGAGTGRGGGDACDQRR